MLVKFEGFEKHKLKLLFKNIHSITKYFHVNGGGRFTTIYILRYIQSN